MFHAVAIGVREVVGEKRVRPWFVDRVLSEDLALLTNDFLDILHQGVELGVSAGVMRGEPEPPAVDAEFANRYRPELRRTVHQVLQVRRGEFERRRSRMQLRRDAPRRA